MAGDGLGEVQKRPDVQFNVQPEGQRNAVTKETNTAKNNAVKQYIPAVFFNKIDSVGKVALAVFFVVSAPASLLGHALAIGVMNQLAKYENRALVKEFNQHTGVKDLNLKLSATTKQIIAGELKSPTILELRRANSEIKSALLLSTREELKNLKTTCKERDLLSDLLKEEGLSEKTTQFLKGVDEKGLFNISDLSLEDMQSIMGEIKTRIPSAQITVVELASLLQKANIPPKRKLTYLGDAMRLAEFAQTEKKGEIRALFIVTQFLEITDIMKGKVSDGDIGKLNTHKEKLNEKLNQVFPVKINDFKNESAKKFQIHQQSVAAVSKPITENKSENLTGFIKAFKEVTNERINGLRFNVDQTLTNELKLITPLYQKPLGDSERGNVQNLSNSLQSELEFYSGIAEFLRVNDEAQVNLLNFKNLGLNGAIPLDYRYPDANNELMNKCLPDKYPVMMPNLLNPAGEPRVEVKNADEFKQIIGAYSTYFKDVDVVRSSLTKVIVDKTLIQSELKRILGLQSQS